MNEQRRDFEKKFKDLDIKFKQTKNDGQNELFLNKKKLKDLNDKVAQLEIQCMEKNNLIDKMKNDYSILILENEETKTHTNKVLIESKNENQFLMNQIKSLNDILSNENQYSNA